MLDNMVIFTQFYYSLIKLPIGMTVAFRIKTSELLPGTVLEDYVSCKNYGIL